MSDLVFDFLQKINFVFLTEIGEENEYVGKLFFDVLDFFRREIAGLLGCLPEEVLQQLPRFNGEGFGEVLGIVELRPVTLVPE